MTVLITGAGTIGCQIAQQLAERGERPILFEVAPRMESIQRLVDLSKVKLVRGDVLEPLDLIKVIQGEKVDRVIHTATLFGLTGGVAERPYDGIKLNIMGTANVLEVSRMLGVKRVVFCSSTTVYFGARSYFENQPCTEDFPLKAVSERPPSIYAATKLSCEHLGMNYFSLYSLDFVAVRYAMVIGPWLGRMSGVGGDIIRGIVERALSAKPGVLEKNLTWSGRMEFVHSKDAALGTVLACLAENPKSRVYNITMGEDYTLQEVLDMLKGLHPPSKIKAGGEALMQGFPACDISRARQELGYEPGYKMKAALEDLIKWLKAQQN